MADNHTTPETPESTPQDASSGARRKKRAAPTIDLTATEVPPAQGAEPSAPPPESEPQQSAQEPPAEAVASRFGDLAGVAVYIAGAAGAAAMTIILGTLWLTGLVPVRYVTVVGVAETKSIEVIAQRLNKIEEVVSKLPAGGAGVTERLAAADNAMKALGIALTAFNHRTDDVAANASQARERADAAFKAITELQEVTKKGTSGISSAEFDVLQKRLAALEQSAKAARDDIAKTAIADRAARLALSAAALRDAVLGGAPFTAELAQVKSLGADDEDLALLTAFAASGVPSAQTLAQELRALLPAMLKISGARAPEGGFFERLQVNADKLVRIRPVDAPPGDDASAMLVRIEIDATKADIPAAIADLGKLTEATRAPAQAWIAKAQACQTALVTARHYAADAASALRPKASAQ